MVEDEWMGLIEAPETTADDLFPYGEVLSELGKKGQADLANTLAWTAVEALVERASAAEALRVAGAFLLALDANSELRAQVVDLYRKVYAERSRLEELLEEAGIAGGRPVRRALRTLEVCLALDSGDWLVERHDDGAARVEVIDDATWEFTVKTPDGLVTLGAVHLADRFMPADATDFRVLRHFDRQRLVDRLRSEPLAILIELCRWRRGSVTSDELQGILVPELMDEAEWKKWWTRARTAGKRSPNIKLTGRNPYVITYVEVPESREEELLAEFDKLYDPLRRLGLVESYLTDCKRYQQQPSADTLRRCYDYFIQQAGRPRKQGTTDGFLLLLIACRVGQWAGVEAAAEGVFDLLRRADDFVELFAIVEDEALLELACTSLAQARPDDWQDILLSLLPTLPQASCDMATSLLVDAGATEADFAPMQQRVLASPMEHFEALLWLWDGPAAKQHLGKLPPLTLLHGILRSLEECQRNDEIPREVVRKISQRSRAVLSARKYERFAGMLDSLDRGVAMTLATQIRRLDNLGRVVYEDLLRMISHRFPSARTEPTTPPWLREEVLFVTEAGKARKEAEVDEHVNVKMKDNARAIGEAAARGDLSENAEYKFALEERDLLRARLAQMNAEMEKAEVFNEEDVPADHVGIGTRVVFKRLVDDQPYELTILGPWEADLSQRIYNYQTPIAQRILGKRIGDVVEFEHSGADGEHEIVALHNALAERRRDGEQAPVGDDATT